MVRGSLREPEKIVLPPEPSTTEPSGPTVDNEAVDRVEVRPDTVQSAIEVLARPARLHAHHHGRALLERRQRRERHHGGGRGRLAAARRHGDGRADPPCHHRR